MLRMLVVMRACLGLLHLQRCQMLATWLVSVVTLCLLYVTELCEFMALPGTEAAVLV